MCFNQTGDISTLNGSSLKLVDKFTYLRKSASSTERDINTRLAKAWTAIDSLSVIWKSDRTDKMKRSFFQATVVSILLYGCTTWTLTKRMEKRLDGNYTRMLRVTLNKSWRQHPTKQQLYGHLPLKTKIIKIRGTRHAGHCWRSKGDLISDVLLWTPSHGRAKSWRPARTYIQQLCADTRCSPEDLPGCPRGVMIKAMACGIVVSEFELQLRYYVHFWTNTLGKDMNPLLLKYPLLNSTTTVLVWCIWR